MSIVKRYKRKLHSSLLIYILLASIFIPLIFFIPRTAGQPPWWNPKWNFRKALILNPTMVNSTLENFPVLIDITDSDLAKAQLDGDDIVFIYGNDTKLNHEIELFNSNSGHLIAWVNIPQLSSSEDTVIYMYYGNPDAENQQNSSAVWNSNFLVVQHLSEKGTKRFDSTVHGNNGTAYNGVSKTDGKIDGADYCDGINDYIQIADSPSLNPPSAVTIELWANLSLTGDYINLVNKGRYNQYYLRLGPQEGRVYWYVKFSDGTSKSIEGYTGWTENTWHYIVATIDTNTQTIKVYVDGLVKINGTFNLGKTLISTANPIRISDITRRLKGTVDEIRLSNISLSSAWIQTNYEMLKSPSDFCAVGYEEQYPNGVSPIIFVSDETPADGSTGAYTNPTLSVRVLNLNAKLMNVTFKEKVSNNWIDIKSYMGVTDGIYSANATSMNKLGTTYYWSVYVTDGQNSTTKTFSFTTTTKILTKKWVASGTLIPRANSGVLIGDINGDGLQEIVQAGIGGVVALNGTDGSVIWNFSDSAYNIGDLAQSQMADLNLDGIPEIVVPIRSPAGLLVLHANNGSIYWSQTNLGMETFSSPVICDIDGDGYPTIFFASTDIYKGLSGSGRVTSLSYNGTILHQTFSWRPCAGGLSIADTDGDGEFELYMGDRDMYMNSTVYGDNDYGKGVQSFWAKNLTLRWSHPDILCSSQIPMLADVTGDGVLDVIIGDLNGGLAVLNSSDGSIIRRFSGGLRVTPTHYQPSVYDIDGDENLELLMADPHQDPNEPAGTDSSDDIVVWDLVDWRVDARIYIGKCYYGPQVADVTGDRVMEIVACNFRGIFIIDRTYRVIDGITGLQGTLNYAVAQDIDGDGYTELVVSSRGGYIYAFDTPARMPDPKPRTEVQFYSEYRRGVAEYVPPPTCQEPLIFNNYPPNGAVDVSLSLSELRFTLTDYQGNRMNYTVTTYPEIGSSNGTNVKNGKYTVNITRLAPFTTYRWTINVTDGEHWTNKSFTFTTEGFVPWWNTAWKYRKKITIDHTQVMADLNNFPVLIDITDSNLANKAQPDGDDIVFTDAANHKLNHEIESYNSSYGHLIAWVNVPFLSSTTNTKIYMYYGNKNATNQQNPSRVWDSNYVMVQHMQENSTTRYDSTVYHNNGTAHGVINKTIGKIDGADIFNGTDGYIQVPDAPSLNPSSAITIELWMNLSITGDYINLVNKGRYNQYYLRLGPQEGRVYWYVKFSDGTSKSIEGYTGWTENTWHYIVATIDTNTQTIKVYVDGVEKLSGTFNSGKNITVTSSSVLISGVAQRWIKGAIDEVRVSNVTRSIEWIYTSYNDQINPTAFYTVGDEESIPEAPMIFDPSPPNKAKNVPLSLTELNFNITDYQGDLINYTVTTEPYIGSGSAINASSGRHTINVTGLEYFKTYTWTVNATDGNHSASITFYFSTQPTRPPTQADPVLVIDENNNLLCSNQSTTDPDGDKVINIYNWYRNGTSITNLLLSFETNSSTTVRDYSGYNNSGIILGQVKWTDNGIVGGAYQFERGFIRIPGSDTLDGGGSWSEITVECWVNLAAYPSGTSRIIARIPSYEIGVSNNKIFASIWTATGNPKISGLNKITSNITIQTGTWNHIVLTYKKGAQLTLYINGTIATYLNATESSTLNYTIQPSGSNPLYMGWFDYFKGKIDEVRIYPKSLTPQQIYQYYIETRTGLTNSSTIVSQETKIGEKWYCEVTPNDSHQDGTTKTSNSITIGFTDNFNDNSTNTEFWKTLQKNNGTVSETNGRVECTVPSGQGTAGYITKQSYNLSDSYIQIEVSNQHLCEAALAITLDGISDHFWYSNNFYVIEKHRWSLDQPDNFTLRVKKRINGGDRVYLYNGTWTGPTGTLAIEIENGIIYFYEDGILHYSEPYELSSYNCYIHFEANTWNTSYTGTDYFDNFILLINKPSAKDLTITPLTPKTTDDLIGNYTFFDPDGDLENGTEIRWYKNGVLQPDLNDTLIVSCELTTKGEVWHFTVRPCDGKEFGATYVSPHILIQNSPPAIDSFTPTNITLEINKTETINFTHTSSDPDNDTLTYSWLLDGIEQSTVQNWTYITYNNSTGLHNVTLVVYDTDLATAQQQWTVMVHNRPPEASNLTITPSNPLTTDDLVANYTYYDIDGDPENGTEILWYKNGTLQPQLNGTLTVPSNQTAKGETWYFTVKPKDGEDFGELKTSPNVTIQNSPPQIVNLTITPNPAYTNDTLTANLTAFDPDGDNVTITYQWQKYNTTGGVWYNITGATNYTLGPENFNKTDQIKVICTPNDGEDYGIPQEANITISNCPPTISSVYPAETNITLYTNQTQMFNVTCYDIDGDNVTIQWYVNQTSVLNQTDVYASSYTFNATKWGAGIYTIKVIIKDGEGQTSHQWTLIVKET